ncbi:hypothetical protein BC828DRAFT_435772 [Blastocladiella britannica]|nr:hypothetical protein BC828DRAFT_435772 [Blastocladiella britannica]
MNSWTQVTAHTTTDLIVHACTMLAISMALAITREVALLVLAWTAHPPLDDRDVDALRSPPRALERLSQLIMAGTARWWTTGALAVAAASQLAQSGAVMRPLRDGAMMILAVHAALGVSAAPVIPYVIASVVAHTALNIGATWVAVQQAACSPHPTLGARAYFPKIVATMNAASRASAKGMLAAGLGLAIYSHMYHAATAAGIVSRGPPATAEELGWYNMPAAADLDHQRMVDVYSGDTPIALILPSVATSSPPDAEKLLAMRDGALIERNRAFGASGHGGSSAFAPLWLRGHIVALVRSGMRPFEAMVVDKAVAQQQQQQQQQQQVALSGTPIKKPDPFLDHCHGSEQAVVARGLGSAWLALVLSLAGIETIAAASRRNYDQLITKVAPVRARLAQVLLVSAVVAILIPGATMWHGALVGSAMVESAKATVTLSDGLEEDIASDRS